MSLQAVKPRAHSNGIMVPTTDCVDTLSGHSLPLAEPISVAIHQGRILPDHADTNLSLTRTNGKGGMVPEAPAVMDLQ